MTHEDTNPVRHGSSNRVLNSDTSSSIQFKVICIGLFTVMHTVSKPLYRKCLHHRYNLGSILLSARDMFQSNVHRAITSII